MADKVAKTGVSKEKGYLYYLGKDGNVWASRMAIYLFGSGWPTVLQISSSLSSGKVCVSTGDVSVCP